MFICHLALLCLFSRSLLCLPCRDIANDILKDPVLAQAVHGIGCHYPGTHSTAQAVATGKPLWASEDDSTYNNVRGPRYAVKVVTSILIKTFFFPSTDY